MGLVWWEGPQVEGFDIWVIVSRYGHKINLGTSRTSILMCLVERKV